MLFFIILDFILLLFGFVLLGLALSQTDESFRYDDHCKDSINANMDCEMDITISSDISDPFVYYEVHNFYANHRKFVSSRDYGQLRGNELSEGSAESSCDGAATMKDIGVDKTWAGNSISDSAVASPCGLIAKYRFTDVFKLEKGSTEIEIKSDDIAHSIDRSYKFQ